MLKGIIDNQDLKALNTSFTSDLNDSVSRISVKTFMLEPHKAQRQHERSFLSRFYSGLLLFLYSGFSLLKYSGDFITVWLLKITH